MLVDLGVERMTAEELSNMFMGRLDPYFITQDCSRSRLSAPKISEVSPCGPVIKLTIGWGLIGSIYDVIDEANKNWRLGNDSLVGSLLISANQLVLTAP
jgi:hypothetical protein